MNRTLDAGLSILLVIGLCLALVSQAQADDKYKSTNKQHEWQEIKAPAQLTLPSGRQIQTGCSIPGSEYSFYFRPGKKDKVVFFFDHGGACYDYATCVGSLQSPDPVYDPILDADDIPSIALGGARDIDGLFDAKNKDNAFRKWSMVFIPYCTGDIHVGSKDTTYSIPGLPAPEATVQHRGFDNFLAVLEWAKTKFKKSNKRHKHHDQDVEEILVAGSSAGAYGAALNYPHIQDSFPQAESFLVADAGNGVLSDSFLEKSIRGDDSNWGFAQNLPTGVAGVEAILTAPADLFTPLYFSLLSNSYPQVKIAQYTTSWDAIQVLFLNIMQNEDPSQWPNLTPEVFGQWHFTMLAFANAISTAPNYRFFHAPGCVHTALRHSDRYYADTTNSGLSLANWLDAMSDDDDDHDSKNTWESIACPETICPPPTPEEAFVCLQ
ncbi:pectin acetylesterase-family hydrolase [Kaarinaea lacus]